VVGSAFLREVVGLSVGLGGVDVDVAVCFDCHCHMRMEGLCREILRGLDSCGVSSFRFLSYWQRRHRKVDIEGGLGLLLCVYISGIT
jgi:hypothetical protein